MKMTTANESEERYVDYLNVFPTPTTWMRPEGPPRIWRVFEGRKKTADGEVPRFSIQEVPKEMEDEVVEFMEKYFLTEEPICIDMGIARDLVAVREFRTMWKNSLRQGTSVIALVMNSDPAAKPVIAGVNLLNSVSAEEKAQTESMLQFKSEANNTMIRVLLKLGSEVDSLKIYGVDRYLSGLGLSVHPSFRGQGIGEELIRARDDIGLAYQIPMSETLFTATASQILAARAGYEVILERNYSELLNDEGKVAFPTVSVKSIKVMAKRLY